MSNITNNEVTCNKGLMEEGLEAIVLDSKEREIINGMFEIYNKANSSVAVFLFSEIALMTNVDEAEVLALLSDFWDKLKYLELEIDGRVAPLFNGIRVVRSKVSRVSIAINREAIESIEFD